MFMNFVWGIVLLIVGISLIASKMAHHDYNKTTNFLGLGFMLVAVILVLSSFIRIVPAGTVGVVDLFGKVNDRERTPGLNFVNPFAKLMIMNVKTEEIKELMIVPSKEGLSINLEVSILHRLSGDMASDIYKKVGVNYRNIVIVPQFRSVCRGVTVKYEAKALYTSSREEISQKVFEDLYGMLEERGVILEKALLRSITLPPTVSNAIELKLKAEQEAEQMKFVLEREKKESERKIIEAEGIAKAQEIINRTLTPAYLQHEAIQAQMQMADSPNHTTVYIPVGDNGLPLVRIADDGNQRR
jgi:regulator of protease activity HflC (stomatin/prohibitin superfamily)